MNRTFEFDKDKTSTLSFHLPNEKAIRFKIALDKLGYKYMFNQKNNWINIYCSLDDVPEVRNLALKFGLAATNPFVIKGQEAAIKKIEKAYPKMNEQLALVRLIAVMKEVFKGNVPSQSALIVEMNKRYNYSNKTLLRRLKQLEALGIVTRGMTKNKAIYRLNPPLPGSGMSGFTWPDEKDWTEEIPPDPDEYSFIFESLDKMASNQRRKDARIIRKVNEEIALRTEYGIRYERLEQPEEWNVICWSNGGESWYVAGQAKTDSRDVIQLDANQIALPYPKELLEKLLPFFNPLPLFYKSTEAKMRGKDLNLGNIADVFISDGTPVLPTDIVVRRVGTMDILLEPFLGEYPPGTDPAETITIRILRKDLIKPQFFIQLLKLYRERFAAGLAGMDPDEFVDYMEQGFSDVTYEVDAEDLKKMHLDQMDSEETSEWVENLESHNEKLKEYNQQLEKLNEEAGEILKQIEVLQGGLQSDPKLMKSLDMLLERLLEIQQEMEGYDVPLP